MIRQGDVALLRDDSARAGDVIPRDNGRVVLAYGEVTGHAHAFDVDHVTLYAPAKKAKSSDRVLKVVGNVAYLKHEEHDKIAIPPGTYRVVRQREWTDADEPRVVAD
jgi:hypothetical protein